MVVYIYNRSTPRYFKEATGGGLGGKEKPKKAEGWGGFYPQILYSHNNLSPFIPLP
jgi:hypothetical protein